MYTPFYVKTENTLLSSMITIPKLINIAKENNLKALAICDDTLYGVMEFYKACLDNGIKPIIGLDVKIDDLNLLLYAKNYKGYQQLTKISTLLSSKTLTLDFILKNCDNLICILPISSLQILDKIKHYFEMFYVGVTKEEEKNKVKEKTIYIPLINSIQIDDLNYVPYLEAIKKGITLDKTYKYSLINAFIKYNLNEDWMVEYKTYTEEIIDNCDITIPCDKTLLPVFDTLSLDAFTYLKKLCIEGMKKRFGSNTYQIYVERLKKELEVISKMGFSNYFLVVWDYVNYARKNDILCHARGSAAGSLVAYLLGITDIDPIIYGLLFERFLNPMRISMPDIDMDIEDTRRNEVIDYCINKYGKKRVSGIITYITLKPKLVIRDVARVMEISPKETDIICSMLKDKDENHKNLSLMDNYQKNSKLRNYINSKPYFNTLFKVALKLENIKKNISSHAAGIIISSKDLDNYIPLVSTKSMYLSGYSMEYLEDLGLLKMDFLGLKNLTIISQIVKDLKNSGIKIDLDKIPLNDKKTLDIFKTANTIGIFQFEKEGMRDFLRKLKPNCFEDIFAALALYRPGPMKSIPTYIKRKQGIEKVDYIDSSLEAILKPTYGIIIYQEQIMQIVHVMADYTLGEADILRKAISKKKDELMKKELEEFTRRAINKGYKKDTVKKVSDLLLKFAEYGYNRSHSVAYAFIAYKLAYLKAHYQAYFMKNIMNNSIGRSKTTKDYIYECKCNNLNVLKPSINHSGTSYIVEKNSLRYPLNNIKNVGDVVAILIVEERKKGLFKDIYDFIKRMYSKTVNKKVLISLIDAGCFDEFGLNRKTIKSNLDIIINYGELLKDIDEEYALRPDIQYFDEYQTKEIMEKEYEVFGFYFTNNPVTKYRSIYQNTLSLKDLPKYFNQNIKTIIMVKNFRVIQTKNKENMCFITGEDEMDNMDFILFPKIFSKYFDIQIDDIILVSGKVERRFEKYQIIVNEIKKL